jgi:hypothetical protein
MARANSYSPQVVLETVDTIDKNKKNKSKKQKIELSFEGECSNLVTDLKGKL